MPGPRTAARPIGSRRLVPHVAGAVAVAAVLGACAPLPTPSASTVGTATREPSVAGALAVEVRQSRADWAARVVQVRVTNEGDAPVEVSEAELTTSTTAGPAAADPSWSRTVPPGRHRDVSVALGEPVCPQDPGAAGLDAADGVTALVTLRVTSVPGTPVVTAEADDPQGHLARIQGEDCAAAAVAEGAVIRPAAVLVVHDGVARLDLAVSPVAGGPAVTIDRVDGTVLLGPTSGAAWELGSPGLAVVAPTTIPLEFTPARCDAHAVGEDKRGTFLGLHTSVDGVPQPTFYVGVDDDVRGQVYDYIAATCGW